jgi:hypothetical protein
MGVGWSRPTTTARWSRGLSSRAAGARRGFGMGRIRAASLAFVMVGLRFRRAATRRWGRGGGVDCGAWVGVGAGSGRQRQRGGGWGGWFFGIRVRLGRASTWRRQRGGSDAGRLFGIRPDRASTSSPQRQRGSGKGGVSCSERGRFAQSRALDMVRGPVPLGERAALGLTCAPLSSCPLRAG